MNSNKSAHYCEDILEPQITINCSKYSQEMPMTFSDLHQHQPEQTSSRNQKNQHPTPFIIAQNSSPLHQDEELLEENENLTKFYQEFQRIYTISHHLALQKKRQFELLHLLNTKIHQLDEKLNSVKHQTFPKKQQISEENKAKRPRRTAEEIEKKYKCDAQFCDRLYGSQGSLQQHIKLKHPQLYRSELSHSFDEYSENS